MKMGIEGWLVLTITAMVPRLGVAQEECPVTQIGQVCDAGAAGTCISAKCSETADGATTSRDCAACVTLPPNACADAGDPCGDGGVCDVLGSAGGGGGNGSSSFMIGYSYGVCQSAVAGGGDVSDAAARGTLGTGSAGGPQSGGSGAEGADTGTTHATSSVSGGSACSVSAGGSPAQGVVWLGVFGLLGSVAIVRRRKNIEAPV